MLLSVTTLPSFSSRQQRTIFSQSSMRKLLNLERFKNLFGRAITALEILTPNGLTAEQVREWTLLDAMPLDVIEPFTKAELEEVDFSRPFAALRKRSASASDRRELSGSENSDPGPFLGVFSRPSRYCFQVI